MEHRIIFKDPAHYASFPRVRRMGNGELLLHYYDQSDSVRAQHPNIHPHYQFGSRRIVLRSRDEGESWDYENVRILRADGAVRDIGYPNSVQLQDGRIFTTYYFTKSDGIRHIAATVWSV